MSPKNFIEDAGYLLFQSVSLFFLFIFIVSVVSVEDVKFFSARFIRFS